MSESDFFNKYKQKQARKQKQAKIPEVFFLLFFKNGAARLMIVDKDLSAIQVSYTDYFGVTKDLLKSMETIETRANKKIQWGQEEQGINLSENAFLLWQLKRCESFIDENKKQIQFAENDGKLILNIEGGSQYECKLGLKHNDLIKNNIYIVSEHFVFHEHTIYGVKPVGISRSDLVNFQTLILPSELEQYLSLFYSYCEGVELRFLNYQVHFSKAITPRPTLIIEKVTDDRSLYIKVVHSISGFDPEFIDQYSVSSFASVDHNEQIIEVKKIIQPTRTEIVGDVRQMLNRMVGGEDDLDFYQDDNFFIIDSPLSVKFIQEGLPQLLPNYLLYGSEKLQSYNTRFVKPKLNVSFNSGIDFFQGIADLEIAGEQFSFFEALHQFKNRSYVQLNDGSKAFLDHEYMAKLERIFEKEKDNVKVSFFDLPIIDELLEDRVENEGLDDARKVFEGFYGLKDKEINLPHIAANPRPYQIDGFKWLRYLYENSLGGCLADDMGLGKTLQALMLLASIYPEEKKPSLIIVPKSLVFNWMSEIERFCPDLNTAIYYGSDRIWEAANQSHLIITTYGTTRNDIEILKEISFKYLILDESQTIKNHESQVSKAVSILNSENRLALSGTPIENNLTELYSLFRFLNPAMFGSLARFQRQYLFQIQQNGDEETAKELKQKIYPFIMRRLKKDVLADLPEKIENTVYVEMSENQKKLYEQRRRFFYDAIRNRIETEGINNSRFFVLQAITTLRQIASIPEVKTEGRIQSPKRELVVDMLADALANDHKVLLFANFLGVLEYLAEDLKKINIDYETLTGATRNREIPVKRFQNDPNCRVFLMTLKTGGQGLNLTAADTIYIFDPWWNLAAENQAIDRSHRIGQQRTVFSYKMITKDSIEEKMLYLQQKKRLIFESIISDESMSFQNLNEEDIDYLMN